MDLKQRKLNKSEWESIEIPVSKDEISVLDLIIKGYSDVNIKINNNQSLISFLKMEISSEMEDYLYTTYFAGKVKEISNKYPDAASYLLVSINSKIKIKKGDMIRLEKYKGVTSELIQKNIYEYVLIDCLEQLLNYKFMKLPKKSWEYYYFTLFKLVKNNIININRHVKTIVNQLLRAFEDEFEIKKLVENSVEYIERNEKFLKYGDMTLYEHQKELFSICKNPEAKLVLYIAPTGTGKTLSPIGLSEKHRVIFVCAARHVGLALARAAISVNKKIAFAFGCSSAEEIRLHYFAAKDYTKNWKTGGIWKVDNTCGEKVEIIICDIKSYIPAMLYMLAFNNRDNIITYWDEPTITMDYDNHEFHDMIKKNWSENLIPNMVLSSATLPKIHEIPDTTSDFMSKFSNAVIHSVISHDCKKTIPILDKNGYVILPHNLAISSTYSEMIKIIEHCENYLTLLRYFDLSEVVRFIQYILQNECVVNAQTQIQRRFTCIDDVDMRSIKLYYLKLLKNIPLEKWSAVYQHFNLTKEKRIQPNDTIDTKGNRVRKYASIGPGVVSTSGSYSSKPGNELTRTSSIQVVSESNVFRNTSNEVTTSENGTFGLYVSTKDAYSLTDGPTIFLANDIEKIAKFCIQQANIPEVVMTDIHSKIDFNNKLNEKISQLEKDLEDVYEKSKSKTESSVSDKEACLNNSNGKKKKMDHKLNRDSDDKFGNNDIKRIMNELEMYRSMIKTCKLNDIFVPNSSQHLEKWAEEMGVKNAYTSMLEDETILKIMMLHDVENSWKVLLLMGIGVFTNHESIAYTEIMKNLADQQKLYMIIASSDYIYGTNYQFCHGYLSKDMNLTQEKIIQAMGRIGRNKIQQEYSVRFRDDEQLRVLFSSCADKPEIKNMNRLFVS